MSVLCSEQRVTRGVCSDTHLSARTHTCIRDPHIDRCNKASWGQTASAQVHTCISSMWLWLIHSGIHDCFRQVRGQPWSGRTIPPSPAELATTSILNWLLVSALSLWSWRFLYMSSGTNFLKAQTLVPLMYLKWESLIVSQSLCGYLFVWFIYQSKTSPFMSIFTAVYLSTCAMNGQYLCMYLVALLFKSLSFHPSMGRLQSVLVSYCAAVSYFPNTRVSFASDSIPFNSRFFSMAPLAYISLSVHQRADSFFSSSKSTFLFS